MPAETAWRRELGMARMIFSRVLNRERSKNKTPDQNTAPKASSIVSPKPNTAV